MNYLYKGRNRKIKDAIKIVYKVINSMDFRMEMMKIDKFYNTSLGGKHLYYLIQNNKELLLPEIKTYWNPFGSAVAKVKSSQPNVIFINTGKRWNKFKLAGTLAHEWIHVLDRNVPEDFGHSFYWHKHRCKSAPYAIGYLVTDVARRLYAY